MSQSQRSSSLPANQTGSALLRNERTLDILWLLLFGAASTWWCVAAARALSATFDEPTYVHLGLEHWRTGSCRALMKLGAMPLSIDVQTLPLYLWERWRGVPIDPAADLPWGLPWARAGTLVFWWMLLIYVWRAARELGGIWAGRLAVSIIACEPVFLAHASLATSDLAVAACLLAFLFEFRRHRRSRWPRRILIPAALYGIAVLAKASALVFGVIAMIAIELERLIASGALQDRGVVLAALRVYLRDSIAIVLGGIAVTFIYCGSDWTREPTFIAWAQGLAPGRLHNAMLWSAEHLCIFSNAGEGLVQQIKHNIRGHLTYLLGQESRRGIWFYFPVALAIKTTLPLLLLPVAAGFIRPRALWNWAAFAAVALLIFSITCRVQIGVRFMLPLLTLLAIGGAAAVVHAGWSVTARARRLLVGLVSAGLVWNAAASVAIWPEALCYANPAWGGTRHAYRLLSDSNYDWGQGLLELEAWRAQHGVEQLGVWYFGTDPRVEAAPFANLRLHSAAWLGDRSPAEVVNGKCVAVSTTLLYGGYASATEQGRAAAKFFRVQQPVDRTTTFFIYDFRH